MVTIQPDDWAGNDVLAEDRAKYDPLNPQDEAAFGMFPRSLLGELTAYEIAVYMVLSCRSRENVCWMKHQRIAAEGGMGITTVRRALAGLKRKGIVTWEPRYWPDGHLMCNTYTIHVAPSPQRRGRGARRA